MQTTIITEECAEAEWLSYGVQKQYNIANIDSTNFKHMKYMYRK